MKACFASQMRDVDRAASEIGGIPSIVLMENAAIACVKALKEDFDNLIKLLFCQLNLFYSHHLTTPEQINKFNEHFQKLVLKSEDEEQNKKYIDLMQMFSNESNVTYSEIEFN